MKYPIQCATCDWTHTDPDSIRAYLAANNEVFSRLCPGNSNPVASRSKCFNLEPDGTFDCSVTAFRLSGEELKLSDVDCLLVCAECGHGLQGESLMKWYVRDLGTGKVDGPMYQGEADIMQQRMEQAVMFHARIFEPQFVPTEEVELLLNDLKKAARLQGFGRSATDLWLAELLRKAIDALILISREKVVKVAIESGVFNLTEEMPSGVRLVVRDYTVCVPPLISIFLRVH